MDNSATIVGRVVTVVRVKVRLALGVAAIAIAMAVGGCSGEPAPVVSTPAFATEDEAFAAAELTYRNYVDALNQVDLSDPATFEEVYRWTTGDLNAANRKVFSQMHADRWIMGGQSTPRLIAKAPGTRATATQVTIAVCLDVSEVEVVDERGTSVVSPDRRDMQSMLVTLEGSPASSSGYQIGTIAGREGPPDCVDE